MKLMAKKTKEEKDFEWKTHPDLEKFVNERVSAFLTGNGFARKLSERMLDETSTRFVDWIDHMVIPEGNGTEETLRKLGLVEMKDVEKPDGLVVFKHKASYLFPILVGGGKNTVIALKPENIDDFIQALGLGIKPEGEPFSHIRYASINKSGNFILNAIERRGFNGYIEKNSGDVKEYLSVLSSFFCRKRYFEDDKEGLEYTEDLVLEATKRLDSGRVADAFFRSERAYWQRKNRSGQIQKERQDRLGLGWGNHDHHTYRSSRDNFRHMITLFETMGYECREKYYAGEDAGWGAQILEHPVCDIVVFTDVDLDADETRLDFPHEKFRKKPKKLGTVGLWVGLHGESILQAGMHHLEARFVFEKLKEDLKEYNVDVMPPFSYFDFLKQAFTRGEFWKVDKSRLDSLLSKRYITMQQYDEFLSKGAIGSHMENLERDQGFKGFNKASVTNIILKTDPRRQNASGA